MDGPLVITGINGQVGKALLAEAKSRGLNVVGLNREQLDLTEIESIALKLDAHKPSAIINPAAYTAVDKAEEEEPRASLINAQAPSVMAAYCRKKDIPFIHFFRKRKKIIQK